MDAQNIDWERLDRYVRGLGTLEERAELERRIEADPELRAIVEAMRSVGRPPEAEPSEWDVPGGWQRLHGRMRLMWRGPLRVIDADTGEIAPWDKASRRRLTERRVQRWRKLATAAAIVVTAGSAVILYHSTEEPVEAPAVAVEMREITTGRRQRSVQDLPDGSRVMLAPESRLRIPVNYGLPRGPRELYLEGQAHFEVEHDKSRPFRVYAANGVAEDLGTEFVVTAYPESDGMEVYVTEGMVALHQTSEGAQEEDPGETPRPLLTLTRGDLAHLDPVGTATLTRGVDVDARAAWTRGSLVFDGTRLADALPMLERWYDIDIRLADPALDDRRLTATFGGEPLAQVLELLGLSLEVDIERNGRTVILTSRGRTGRSS